MTGITSQLYRFVFPSIRSARIPVLGLVMLGFLFESVHGQSFIKDPSFSTTESSLASATNGVDVPESPTPEIGLPSNAGQVWKSYDLRAYTEQIRDVERPQQAVIDWILRETGSDVWFHSPLGILNASHEQLRVYHTPAVQQAVAGVVNTLVQSHGRTFVFDLHLVTVNSPNWRSPAVATMRPVPMQTQGAQAWLVSKEDAAVLRARIGRRFDFRQHNSPNFMIANGQSHRVSRRQPKNYLRSIDRSGRTGPGVTLKPSQIQEGFDLSFSPLVALDERVIDCVIECDVDQVERFVPVAVDVPSTTGVPQRVEIQVPQMASWKLKERFRWPGNHVLLVACGMVASPGPVRSGIFGINSPFTNGGQRADALLFIEFKGRPSDALTDAAAVSSRPLSQGRY